VYVVVPIAEPKANEDKIAPRKVFFDALVHSKDRLSILSESAFRILGNRLEGRLWSYYNKVKDHRHNAEYASQHCPSINILFLQPSLLSIQAYDRRKND